MYKFIFYDASLSATIILPLRRSVQGFVLYSTNASQFTQTLSAAKWKGRTLVLLNRYSAFNLQSLKIKGLLTPPSGGWGA
jgi:hypothetical protein